MNIRLLCAAFFLAAFNSAVFAGDISSCADELDRLKKITRNASDAADDAKSKSESLDYCHQRSNRTELHNGSCANDASSLKSAQSNLSSELDTLERRYKSVADACEIEGPPLSVSQKTGDPQCDLYRRYMGQLPIAALLQTCSQHMPQGECEKCMSFQPTVPGALVPRKTNK